MDNLTDIIKKEIKNKYGSVRQFSEATGISRGTLNTALYRGFGSSSFDFVIKVCKLLGIKQIFDDEINQAGSFYDTVKQLELLDTQGLARVEEVISEEIKRCENKKPEGTIRGFSGMGRTDENDEHLKELIREVLEEQLSLNKKV